MRGDSLRDLYAKTLALLGLGVLAGTGALVDYWPVGVHMPAAPSALRQPLVAHALSVPRFSVPVQQSHQPSFSRVRFTSADAAPAPRVFPLPVDVSFDAGVGQPVGLFEPESQVAMATTQSADAESLSAFAEPDLSSLIDDSLSDTVAFMPTAAVTDDASPDGFLTSALKKTGTSIVRSGLKTGTSIVEAFRVVGEVVRKALPN